MVFAMQKKNRRINKNVIRRRKIWNVFWLSLVCMAILAFVAIDVYKLVPQLQYWRRNREIKQGYVKQVEKLRQEQDQLEKEKDKLKNNVLTQEKLAREMGYIKPGETVYKITPKTRAHVESGL